MIITMRRNAMTIFFLFTVVLVGSAPYARAQNPLFNLLNQSVPDLLIKTVNQQIRGKIRSQKMEFSPPSTLILHQPELLDKDGNTVIRAQRIKANLSLLSLFIGKIKLDSVEAQSPRVHLSTRNKILNIEQIFASQSKSTTVESSSPRIQLDNIDVSDGEFEWSDDSGNRVQAHRIGVLGNILIGPKGVSIRSSSLRIKKGEGRISNVSFSLDSLKSQEASYADGILTIDNTNANVMGAQVRAKGSVNFARDTLSLFTQVDAPKGFWPKGVEAIPFSLPRFSAKLSIRGPFTDPNIDVKSSFDATDLYDVSIKKGALDFTYGQNKIVIKEGNITLADNSVVRPQGTFEISTRQIDMQASFDKLTWTSLKNAIHFDVDAEAQLSGNATVRGIVRDTEILHINGDARVENLGTYGLSLSSSTLNIAIDWTLDRAVEFKVASLRTEGFHAEVSGPINLQTKKLDLDFDVHAMEPNEIYRKLPSNIHGRGFKASGKIGGLTSSFVVKAQMALATLDVEKMRGHGFTTSAHITPKVVVLEKLKGKFASGQFRASAKFALEHKPAKLSGELTLDDASLAQMPFLRQFRSNLRGRANVDATLAGDIDHPRIDARVLLINVHVDPLFFSRIDGQLTYASRRLQIAGLIAQMPIGKIESNFISADFEKQTLQGHLTLDQYKLEGTPQLADLGISGLAKGKIVLAGSPSKPQVEGSLILDDVAVRSHPLGSGKTFIWYNSNQDGLLQISGELAANEGIVRYRSTLSIPQEQMRLEILLNDLSILPWLSFKNSPLLPLRGHASGRIVATGHWSRPDVKVDVTIPNLEYQQSQRVDAAATRFEKVWLSAGPLQISAHYAGEQLTASVCGFPSDLATTACTESSRVRMSAHGRFSSMNDYNLNLESSIRWEKVENWIRVIRDELMSLDFDLNMAARVTHKPSQTKPVFSGHVDVNSLRLALPGVLPITLDRPTRLQFKHDELELTKPAILSLATGQLTIKGGVSRSRLNLDVDGRIPLVFAKFLSPYIVSAQGLVTGTLKLRGSPERPLLSGEITPDQGAVIKPRAIVDDITFLGGSVLLSSSLPQKTFSTFFKKLEFRIGDGNASLNGEAHFATQADPDTAHFATWNLQLSGNEIVLRDDNAWLETNFDLNLITIGNRDELKGHVSVSDGHFFKKFAFRNFVLSSSKTTLPKLPPWLGPLVVNIDIAVRSYHAEAQMAAFLLDSYLTADLKLIGTLASPRLVGAMEISEGALKFPLLAFDIPTTSIPFKNTPGRFIDPQIRIFAYADLPQKRFGLSQDTTVELSLIGNLEQLRFDIKTVAGDKSLDRTQLLLALIGSTKGGSEAIEEALTSYTGTRILIGSTLQPEGVATQVQWQLSPRLEIEGTTATSSEKMNFQDLKLRFMIFDHLPFGKQLFFEGAFFSPAVESSEISTSENLRLKFRIMEQ